MTDVAGRPQAAGAWPSDGAEPPVVDVAYDLRTPAADGARAEAAAFVVEALRPHAAEWDAAGELPREVFAAAGRAGLLGWKVHPAFGGRGPDLLADAAVSEELAVCGSGGVAAALGAHKDLGPYYLWRFGTDEQRRRWVEPAVRGELVGALAVTEPGAGSDVAGLRTRAVRRPGGDWVLDGTKAFITNGTYADVLVVAAVTDPDAGGHHGQTLFAVEAGDRGLSRTRMRTLGWRASSTAELAFTDLRLPADRVVGGEAMLGRGFACIMRNFQWERIGMALGAVRSAEASLARLVAAEPAGRAADVAALAAEVAQARALARHALRLHLHGVDAVREVSMAKWSCCEVAVRAAEAVVALPVLAADGEAQRALRDARLGPIGGGTTEIMQEVVGRTLGI